MLVVPVLIGMFWGAPLIAHELETGTFRLAWTQSVSRLRWLLVKLGLVGLASAAVAGLLSLMVTWWFSPIDKVNQDRFGPAAFGLHGFVPAGYALFAFALGATTGLLFRRTLPAMAVTLVGFVVARLDRGFWIRPHFMSPVAKAFGINPNGGNGFGFAASPGGALQFTTGPPNIPNALGRLEQRGQQRRAVAVAGLPARACPNLPGLNRTAAPAAQGGGAHAAVVCRRAAGVPAVHHHHFGQVPPGGHVPAGQPVLGLPDLRDAAVRGASAALAGLCVWWVRHRLS